MRLTPVVALLAGAAASAGAQDRDARYSDPRNATVDAAGARSLYVEAQAGILRIEGRSGLREVRVTGTARASRERDLDDIRLDARRVGDEVRVIVDIPDREHDWENGDYRGLDLVIEVPNGLAVTAQDGSGDAEVRGVARLDIKDGSGGLILENIGGELRVADGSGELRIRSVRGDVQIRDGSGEVELREITGGVEVEDGSGQIDANGVGGTVRVVRDGSGSVHVSDVGGDFVVSNKGSGGIRYDNVKGSVRVPDRDRSRAHDH